MTITKFYPRPTLTSIDAYANCKVGLLGGSFNPAHSGHLEISRFALQHLKLDAVWWLVSQQNPLKNTDNMAKFEDRLVRAQQIVAHEERIFATGIEQELDCVYTHDTLVALKKNYASTRFVWLMGTDNLAQIDNWHKGEDIFHLVPIAVFRRKGYDEAALSKKLATYFRDARLWEEDETHLVEKEPPAWLVFNNPINQLSATLLRDTSFNS